MTNLVNLSKELFSHCIFPFITARDTWRFGMVSTATHALVAFAANSKRKEDDITLAGKSVVVILDGSVSALLRQKIKMEILANQPELLANIDAARTAVSAAGKNLDDIQTLLLYANELYFTNILTKNIDEKQRIIDVNSARALMLSIILFDFNIKQIQADGVDGLVAILNKSMEINNHELVQALFSHPNAAEIPAEGIYSLGMALGKAVDLNNLKLVRRIFSHPNAVNIPAEGPIDTFFGLGAALVKAIELNNPEIVRLILSHPNAKQISVETKHVHAQSLVVHGHLGQALEAAIRVNNPEFVKSILSLPNAPHILIENNFGFGPEYGLKAALSCAKQINNPEIIEMISAALLKKFPQAKETANQMDVVEDIVILPAEYAAMLQLKIILEQTEMEYSHENPLWILETLSVKTQELIYKQLCQTHGSPTGNAVKDGIQHIVSNPRLLLPIINQLIDLLDLLIQKEAIPPAQLKISSPF